MATSWWSGSAASLSEAVVGRQPDRREATSSLQQLLAEEPRPRLSKSHFCPL